MAESGGQSVTDLVDLTHRKRRGSRARTWFFLVVVTLISVSATAFAAVCAVGLIAAQADQNSYDKAPFCAEGTTNTHDCVLRTTATVEWVHASKNTGKNAHGFTTEADLQPYVGATQTVTVSKSQDLSSQIDVGDTWPVLVWRENITRYTLAGTTHDAGDNPHAIVDGLLMGAAASLVIGSASGRPLLRRLLRTRIAVNPARHRIPDWTLVLLSLATVVAAILRASWFVSGFALAAVVVLIGSGAVWPFLRWVQHPNPDTWLPVAQLRAAQRKR